jgi:hypothetical protein
MARLSTRCCIVAPLFVLPTPSLFGCFCLEGTVCDTFSDARAFFIGKVVSQDPSIDLWDPDVRNRITDLVDKTTPGALASFKQRYASEFPAPVRAEVEKASSGKQVVQAINKLGPQFEKRVTFAVHQAYKGVESNVKLIDVWTQLTDCGARFSNGETYVVYA